MREEDLERCLQIQALTGGSRPLGQILLEEGVITEATLEELLALQERRRRGQRETLPVHGQEPDRFLSTAALAHASDLILSEGRPVLVRVAGQLRSLTEEPLSAPEIWQFVREYMGQSTLDALADRKSVTQEFARRAVGRGRITAFRHFDGIGVVLRLHPDLVRKPREAGLGEEVIASLQAGKGLVLITGEVRSGLTETMGTLLHEVARQKRRLILVLDDTLEYPEPAGETIVVRRRVGRHTQDYASGLKAAVREEPDVVFVGDASTPEVFDMALRAAEGGRLVVAALHARSVAAALERAVNFYPVHDVQRVRSTLASVLRCVVAQQLVPDAAHAHQILATEVLLLDDAAREVIRDGVLSQITLLMRLEGATCGHSMDDSLLRLLRSERIRFEDAFGRAEDKAKIMQLARGSKEAGAA